MSTWTSPEESGIGEIDHPRLLPELLDLVLSFLDPADVHWRDVKLFTQYSLVSKDWLDPSRRHLFKHICLSIDKEQKLVDFTHFVASSPHISPYIRSLALFPDMYDRVSVQKLAVLLRYLSRLDTLVLHMLFITSTADIESQNIVSSFHLNELRLIFVSFGKSSATSSPLYDLFNIFSSIQTLTIQVCTFGSEKLQRPTNTKRVAISRINYSPGEDGGEEDEDEEEEEDEDEEEESSDEEEENDKPLSILFRDYIDLSSLKTVGAQLITASNLTNIVRLIDETFKSADSPLNIEFVFSAIPRELSGPLSDVESLVNHLPLTHALISATLILELSGDDIDDVSFLRVISTQVLSRPPPNIQWLSLEVEIETWYPSIPERVEILKQFDWAVFGRCIKGWRTLEHIQIVIRLGKGDEDEKSTGIAELRDDILHGVGIIGNVVKRVTFV